MPTKVTPGSGAEFFPHFNSNYGVSSIDVLNGGSGYASTDPPKIEITGTKNPIIEGIFYPVINGGEIKKIVVLEPGIGYLPETSTVGEKIGIRTTANVESSLIVQKGEGENIYLSVASSESNIIMSVEGGNGTSLYENGYNAAISTSIVGISATVVPDFSLNQNNFFGYFFPFPAYSTSGIGTDAKFSAFIVYNSSTGNAISTSLILREGGRGYAIGDTVSISGTFMNGTSPANDLTFTVSTVANTRIVSAANSSFTNLPSYTISGFGTGATFNVSRDSLGGISVVSVSYGGVGYALTDRIGISGTYIGGISPQDDLLLSPKMLGTNKLPETLYVTKLDDNNFKVSGLSTSLELDIVSYGLGTQSIELENSLESTIISIDNIIQSQIYKRDLNVSLASTVEIDSNYIYITEGISSITSFDIIQVNSELLKVKNLGVGATNEVEVERRFMGSPVGYHTVGAAVTVLRGDFNIIKDTIHFSAPPYGPTGYPGNTVNSTFQGRVFSRQFDPGKLNDKNVIFDDISSQFVSASSTEFYLKTNNQDIVGIYTDTNSVLVGGIDINNNPLVLINNIPQISNTDFTIDTPGKNRLKFLTGTPSAGKISRTGISTGYGYQPLISAGATVTVGSGGTIASVTLLGSGSGYRTPPVIRLLSSVGSGASFTASVGSGGTITQISIVNPGSGYTSSPNPILVVGIPSSYSDLDLEYIDGSSGNGFGAKASVVVGNKNNIIGFNLEKPGQYYKVGDVLKIAGIVTDPTIGVGFSEFRITVENTLTDKFSGFYPGQFIQFDNISSFFTGTKRKFTLTITEGGITQLLSLKTDPSSDLRIENNLFVFINDILQEPFSAYRFSGSRITMLEEAPRPGSKCTILFYRGSDLDVEEITPPKTIKEGDTIQIGDSILDPIDRAQFERVVKKIVSTDSLDTFTYDSIGINTDPTKDRPLRWTKQTEDKIINGVLYSKSRPDLKSRVIPNTKLITNLRQEDNQIYVDNAFPIFTDVDTINEDLRDVFIIENKNIEPGIASAIVSSASTISNISIIDPGNNYASLSSPYVAISSSFIVKKDPIYNWRPASGGISTEYNINSIAFGSPIVAVGSSEFVATSIDGTEWTSGILGFGATVSLNSVAVGNTSNFLAVADGGRIFYSVGVGTNLSSWSEVIKLKEEVILGLPDPVILGSTYTSNLNSIHYSPSHDIWVIAGDDQTIFTGSGISTSLYFEKTPPMFGNLYSITSNSFRFVAVGESASIVYSQDGNIWTKVKGLPSTRNFYDVIWTGDKFVLVGESGDIFYSPSGSTWEKVVSNLSVDLVKIRYEYGFYTALDSLGSLYFSFNLTNWILRDTLQSSKINDLMFIPPPPPPEIRVASDPMLSEEGRYLLVGENATIMYAEPIYNRAIAISSVTSGSISSISITNPGFGYSQSSPPAVIIESDTTHSENIRSIKAKGDFGIIKYVGVSATTISFVLQSETYDNVNLGIGYSSLNTYGVTYSEIEVGDYFTIFDSNSTIGHALTGITTYLGGLSNYPESKVGTATSYLNGVYRAEEVSAPSAGIVTVRCNFTYGPNGIPIQVNVNTNENGIYGKYSWGKIYDYQNRSKFTPKDFYVNTDNGLVGLNTSPIVYRTRGLA
jgi:hypothetical protein